MILYRNMTLPLSYTLVLTNTPLNIDRMIEQCQSQEPRVQGGQTQQIAKYVTHSTNNHHPFLLKMVVLQVLTLTLQDF